MVRWRLQSDWAPRWLPALLWALFIFALSSQSHPPGAGLLPDTAGHFILYSVLAGLLVWGESDRMRRRLSKSSAAAVWLFSSLYGLSDEFHQSFVSARSAEIKDLAVDSAAALAVAGLAFWVLRSAACRRNPPPL